MEICQHLTQTPKRFKKSNGSIVVKFQCNNCGAGLLESPKSLHAVDQLEWFDYELRQAGEQRQFAEARQKWQEQSEQKSEEWWERYNLYLKSPNWRVVRSIVIERDQTCQMCFQEMSVEAHHLTYQSYNKFGITFPLECVGLCRRCHNELHQEGVRL